MMINKGGSVDGRGEKNREHGCCMGRTGRGCRAGTMRAIKQLVVIKRGCEWDDPIANKDADACWDASCWGVGKVGGACSGP